jgi:hypothetical protein
VMGLIKLLSLRAVADEINKVARDMVGQCSGDAHPASA